MQHRPDLGWLMTTVLAAIAAPVACGGSTSDGVGAGAGTGGTVGIGGTTGTTGSGGTQAPAERPGCTPVASTGKWSGGFVECAEGYVHRAEVAECSIPRRPACDPASAVTIGCIQDADCAGYPGGACVAFPETSSCACTSSCSNDADCGPGQVCHCGSQDGVRASYCTAASCTSDADCTGGRCAEVTVVSGTCNTKTLRCVFPRQPADACAVDRDCGQGSVCLAHEGSPRSCAPAGCGGIGRPFLVHGSPRLPSSITRSDWSDRDIAPGVEDLDPALRERLAAAWTEAGQMEHASIAAFARFVLELLAFGAPADLVERTQAAIADEMRHAKLCFALASAYADRPIGPGPLAMTGVEVASDLPSSLLCAFVEGCIGETVAAAEAAEAAALALDPAIAAVLVAIARDEARHAALAWSFVAWALASMPGAEKTRALSDLAAATARAGVAPFGGLAAPIDLSLHGVLSGARRAELRREVLANVVRPCLRALATGSHVDAATGGIRPAHGRAASS